MKFGLPLLGLFLCLTAGTWKVAEGSKILLLSVMSTKSQRIVYEPLLRELARKGHEVTVIHPYPTKDEKNFKNIPTVNIEEAFNSSGPNFFEMKLTLPWVVEELLNPYLIMGGMMKNLCKMSYELPQVQAVLKEKFDLIIFSPLFNECLWGVIHKMNTSVIIFQPTIVLPWVAGGLGSPSPPSFAPAGMVAFSDQMTFFERLYNTFRAGYDWSILHLYFYPMVTRFTRELLGDPNIPCITEIQKNASLVLANSHIAFSRPRPIMNDIIEVGGLNMKPAKPVPKELDEFLSGSEHGFILFSMGSALQGSMMPENYRRMFLNVFSKLKQRVIWKWETEQMEGLPPNVKLSKWLPQQDVLGHKNIKLFITHGGHGSTTEAIYHGVPLIGIPMLGDQPSNMRKAAKFGFALPPLNFVTLTEEILSDAINKALHDPSYMSNARRLSKIFIDQMDKPLDRAVFWVEYVLRHHGATHLRSAARDLNYFQYFSIDTLATLLALAVISLTINFIILRAIFRRCFGSKNKPVSQGKKKN